MATNFNNNDHTYTVDIVETSRELSKIERVQLKTNAASKLEEMCPICLEGITGYAVVKIHNEMAKDNKDYTRLVIFTDDGNSYYTGSPTFMNTFFSIYSEMEGETGWGLSCFKSPSANYKGKEFLSCKLVTL